jgi:phage terminase Nu1 subunit (DNA packaging protein)
LKLKLDKSIDKLKERLDGIEDASREETDYENEARFAELRLARAKKTNAHVIKPTKMSGMKLHKKS